MKRAYIVVKMSGKQSKVARKQVESKLNKLVKVFDLVGVLPEPIEGAVNGLLSPFNIADVAMGYIKNDTDVNNLRHADMCKPDKLHICNIKNIQGRTVYIVVVNDKLAEKHKTHYEEYFNKELNIKYHKIF